MSCKTGTHHHACECREKRFARIEKALRALLDAQQRCDGEPHCPSLATWNVFRRAYCDVCVVRYTADEFDEPMHEANAIREALAALGDE